MTHETDKTLAVPTLEDVERLSNEIILTTYDYLLKIKNEIEFVTGQLEVVKRRLTKNLFPKECEILTRQYNLLTKTLTELQGTLAIGHSANLRPLLAIIRHFDSIKKTHEVLEPNALSESDVNKFPEVNLFNIDEIDLNELYKPYED